MKLQQVRISKRKLASLPENEQALLVQAMQLLNEIDILSRLIAFTMNGKKDNPVLVKAETSQAMFLLRLQMGIMNEGWKLIKNKFRRNRAARDYVKKLSEPARQSLDKMKGYFSANGGKNIITSTRNQFAFHYCEPAEKIAKEISGADSTKDFEIYRSDSHYIFLFTLSDAIIHSAMLQGFHSEGLEAFRRLAEETNQVRQWFHDFLFPCIDLILKKKLVWRSTDVEIPEPPHIGDVKLPFFVMRRPR